MRRRLTNKEEHLSVETPTPSAARDRAAADRYDAGGGWLTFAGILLLIVGTMNFIGGIGAIDDSKFFVGNSQYVIGDLNTWGWIILILGAGQVVTGIGLFARSGAARVVGIGFASFNAIAQLLMITAFPLWSLALFSMDLLIIYGLATYGHDEA
jgi:hypothetical protein